MKKMAEGAELVSLWEEYGDLERVKSFFQMAEPDQEEQEQIKGRVKEKALEQMRKEEWGASMPLPETESFGQKLLGRLRLLGGGRSWKMGVSLAGLAILVVAGYGVLRSAGSWFPGGDPNETNQIAVVTPDIPATESNIVGGAGAPDGFQEQAKVATADGGTQPTEPLSDSGNNPVGSSTADSLTAAEAGTGAKAQADSSQGAQEIVPPVQPMEKAEAGSENQAADLDKAVTPGGGMAEDLTEAFTEAEMDEALPSSETFRTMMVPELAVTLEVVSLQDSVAGISAEIQQLGGSVLESVYNEPEDGSSAQVRLEIPAANLQTLCDKLAGQGKILDQYLETDGQSNEEGYVTLTVWLVTQ